MRPRLKFLTKASLQVRYLALIVIAMAVPLLLVGGCLYYLIFTITAEQIGIPEAIASNLMPVLQKINFMLFIGLPPIFLLLLLWGMALSHRFAGPLERLEKDIKKISEGDYSVRVRIRKDDDLKPIVDAINNLIDKLEKTK